MHTPRMFCIVKGDPFDAQKTAASLGITFFYDVISRGPGGHIETWGYIPYRDINKIHSWFNKDLYGELSSGSLLFFTKEKE